jgi:6-bladed beta-propeller
MQPKAFVVIVLGLFVLAGLAARSPAGPAAGQQVTTKVEDGVPVVHNPKKPVPAAGMPSSLTLKHDLTIGKESGDENYTFSQLRSVAVDEGDNIYALDMKEIKVRVFGKDGQHLRTFGKKGKGPGEIDSPLRMELARGGNLVIEDFGSAKFVFFSLDGTVVKEIPLGKYRFITRFKFNSLGNIFADARTYDETTSVSELIKFSPDFKPLATLASFQEKRGGRVLAAFSPAFALQITRKDNLILTITQTDKYEFKVMDPDAKLIRKVVKDYDPVKVTAAIKDKLMEDSWGDQGVPPGYTFEVPSHLPAIYYFILDDQDRMFVCTYENEKKEDGTWVFYDVFDAEGRYLTRFSLPEREMVFISKKNKLYCMVQESEEGIPQVKRYDMAWK